MQSEKKTSRRAFLKGAALAGAGGVAAGMLAKPAPASAQVPTKWDAEAEILIVGYGGAGAAAAITAADKGAKVLILEKQSEQKHTSNTQLSLGAFISPTNVDDTIAYLQYTARVNVDMPESKDLDDDVIEVFSEYVCQNKDWLAELGVKEFNQFALQGRDPDWPGNDAIAGYQIKKDDGTVGAGWHLFEFLDKQVKDREVEIMWETPAESLITDEKGEVVGVNARDKDGKAIAVKASKAVILTTGGFEYDEEAKKAFFAAYPMTFYGNPDNTGDGMRMAQALGASLWHMTVLGGGYKMYWQDGPTAFAPVFGKYGYMIVDKTGKRFKDETKLGGYSGYWNALVYDTVNYTWPRIPAYWIFDENTRAEAPIVNLSMGAAGPAKMYEWSKDNSAEVEKGWIVKGETIEELAEKLELDPEALKEQLDKYNAAVEATKDEEFDRDATTMVALDKPPFYAVKLWPGLNNTFGGPRRNAKGQIMHVNGQPIPRLYSAGELGSIFVQYPQGGANVGECLAYGRISAENAVAETPWDAVSS